MMKIMNEEKTEKAAIGELIKFPLKFDSEMVLCLQDARGAYLADLEVAEEDNDLTWSQKVILGNWIADTLNASAEKEIERLKEDAKNGGEWFNAFMEVNDFMLDAELWSEADIDSVNPAQTLTNGILRMQAEIKSLRQTLEIAKGELLDFNKPYTHSPALEKIDQALSGRPCAAIEAGEV